MRRRWYRGKGAEASKVLTNDEAGRPHTVCDITYYGWTRAQQIEHHNLITAAPELYEACQMALQELPLLMFPKVRQALIDATARADGASG